MAEIKFSPEAINDLKQIKAYITDEPCNEQVANSTISKILQNVRMLERFPESGASLETVVNFSTNYRYVVCGNHTAFYRAENDTVFVVRVLFGRRDFMRILFGITQEEN